MHDAIILFLTLAMILVFMAPSVYLYAVIFDYGNKYAKLGLSVLTVFMIIMLLDIIVSNIKVNL